MLDAGATPEGIANCLHKALMESDLSLDQLAALMQLGLMNSSSLCPEDIRNTLMLDKILGAAQAAKIIARKINPEQMKLLQAAVSAAADRKLQIILLQKKQGIVTRYPIFTLVTFQTQISGSIKVQATFWGI